MDDIDPIEDIEDIDPIDPRPSSEKWTDLTYQARALIQQQPLDPTMYEPLMAQVEELLLDIADVLSGLNDERYAAEREYTKVKSLTISKYMSHGVTFARAHADIAAEEARKAADDLKVIYHHAEDTQKALVQKHMRLMNVNRGLQGAMGHRG